MSVVFPTRTAKLCCCAQWGCQLRWNKRWSTKIKFWASRCQVSRFLALYYDLPRLTSPHKDSEQFFICKTSSWSQLYFYVCAPAVLSVISAHHWRLFAKGIGTLGLCKTNAITLPIVVLHTKLADKRHGLPKIIPENSPGGVCQIEIAHLERTPGST